MPVVLTDVDGTLLEPDGTVDPEVVLFLEELQARAIPVCAVTSKTAAELQGLQRLLGLQSPAGFENGAGILLPAGQVELLPQAVRPSELLQFFRQLRWSTGAPVRCLEELTDGELQQLTGLEPSALPPLRERQASLPLVVDTQWDETLRQALPPQPSLRLVRGNRFLHLQGDHDKGSVVPKLLELVGQEDGFVIACGDAPNDVELLAWGSHPVVVPSRLGPHPMLAERFGPRAIAPAPHGEGWVQGVRRALHSLGL